MWSPLPPVVLDLVCGAERPDGTLTWEQAARKVNEYRTLEDDYDGQGAKAPAPEVCDGMLELVRGLEGRGASAPTCVTSGVNGSVNLEWDYPGGVSATVEVTDVDEAAVYLLAPHREPGYWVLNQTAAV